MAELIARSVHPFSAAELFAWHERPGAFERLAPPWDEMRVRRRDGGIRDGGVLEFEVKQGPFTIVWKALHQDYLAGRRFCDVQSSGPFARWRHVHEFHDGPGGGVLEDRVTYELPLGWVGRWLGGWFVRTQLLKLFRYRHWRMKTDLNRCKRFAARSPLRIVVWDDGGKLSEAVWAAFSTAGHGVLRNSRGSQPSHSSIAASHETTWEAVDVLVDCRTVDDPTSAPVAAAPRQGDGGLWRPKPTVWIEIRSADAAVSDDETEWFRLKGETVKRRVLMNVGPIAAGPKGTPFRQRGGSEQSWLAFDDLVGFVQFAATDRELNGVFTIDHSSAASLGCKTLFDEPADAWNASIGRLPEDWTKDVELSFR